MYARKIREMIGTGAGDVAAENRKGRRCQQRMKGGEGRWKRARELGGGGGQGVIRDTAEARPSSVICSLAGSPS